MKVVRSRWAAIVLALALLGMFALTQFGGRLISNQGAAGVSAGERSVVGRISEQPFEACNGLGRGRCQPPPAPGSREFAALTRRIAGAVSRSADGGGAEPLRLEALALLALGDAGSLRSAVDRLEAAVALRPEHPPWRADLVAARLSLADALDDRASIRDAEAAWQRFEALADAMIAAEGAPRNAQVAFNLALALTSVGLRERARASWAEVRVLEPDAGWAAEAAERMERLEVRRAHTFPPPEDAHALIEWAEAAVPQARVHVEQVLLSRWAAEADAGGDATAALAVAKRLASLVERRSGDGLLLEAVEAIERTSPGERATLVEAQRSYAAGLASQAERDFAAARVAFERAEGLYSAGRSPLALWARYYVAVCAYGHARHDEAQRLLEELEEAAEYPFLESRRAWMLNLIAAEKGEFARAVDWAERALELLDRLGDPAGAASMRVNVAAALVRLSREAEAWSHRMAALLASAERDDHRLRHVVLIEVSQALIEKERMSLARAFLNEAEVNARAWDRPVAVLEVARLQASVLTELGRFPEAVERLELSERIAGELEDAELVRRLRADLAVERAAATVEQDPGLAADMLERAAALYREIGFRLPLIRLHRLEAGVALARGDVGPAESALSAALDIHHALVDEQEAPADRRGHLAATRSAFEAMISLQAERRSDPEAAFLTAEAYRLEFVERDAELPRNVRALQATVPAGTAIVSFELLPESLLAWVMTPERFEMHRVAAGRATIERLVAAHHAEVRTLRAAPGADSASSELYDLLWRPLTEWLAGATRLVVVADPDLGWIGFSGLWDRRQRAYLLDTWDEVVLAPAASLRALPSRDLAQRPGPILIVGDPAFDRAQFPLLARLPLARSEAESIAAMAPGATLLVDEEASPRRLAAAFPQHRALHFAGHALRGAGGTAFVLAPDTGQSGLLRWETLGIRALASLDLVVLSACSVSSAGGWRRRDVEWVEGLLSSGVGTVIASPFEVEDGEGTPLLVEFYRRYFRGRPAPVSLHEAKKSLQDRPLREWVPFDAYGAAG